MAIIKIKIRVKVKIWIRIKKSKMICCKLKNLRKLGKEKELG